MKTLSSLIILFSMQTMVSQVIIGGVPEERDADGNPIFKAMLEIRNPIGNANEVTKSGVLIPSYASLPDIPTTVADDPNTETDETVNWDGMMIYNTDKKKFMYAYQEKWYLLP